MYSDLEWNVGDFRIHKYRCAFPNLKKDKQLSTWSPQDSIFNVFKHYHGPSQSDVYAFQEALRTALGAAPQPQVVHRFGVQSPLQGNTMQAWLCKARDPEHAVRDWVQKGVPLGINVPIPCFGILPEVEGQTVGYHDTDSASDWYLYQQA